MNLPVDYTLLHWRDRRLVREEYVRIQGGNCWHCRAPLDGNPPEKIMRLKIKKKLFPENFFSHPVHLHHSHRTGLTIGAVHNRCNAVLWQYHGE